MNFKLDQTMEEAAFSRIRKQTYSIPLKEAASLGIVGSATSLYAKARQSASYNQSQAKKIPIYLSHLTCPPHSNRSSKVSVAEVKTLHPKKRKASILLWTDLSVSSVDRLNESASPDHVRQVLSDIFVLDNYKSDPRVAIALDLLVHAIQFSRQEGFSTEKTSAFFSIINNVFEMCVESPFSNKTAVYEYFRDLLACHSLQRPPYSIALFTPCELMRITDYAQNSVFRHFEMYKYAFTPSVSLDLQLTYSVQPPSPPPPPSPLPLPPLPGDVEGDEVVAVDTTADVAEEAAGESAQLINAKELTEQGVRDFLQKQTLEIHQKIIAHMTKTSDILYSKIHQLMLATEATKDSARNEELDALTDVTQ